MMSEDIRGPTKQFGDIIGEGKGQEKYFNIKKWLGYSIQKSAKKLIQHINAEKKYFV